MEENIKKEIEEELNSFREMVAEDYKHFKAMIEVYSYCKCQDVIRKILESNEDESC